MGILKFSDREGMFTQMREREIEIERERERCGDWAEFLS